MPFSFVFVGGFQDGYRVSSDSPKSSERLLAESLWSATHGGFVGESVRGLPDVSGAESKQGYFVHSQTRHGDNIVVICGLGKVPSLPKT